MSSSFYNEKNNHHYLYSICQLFSSKETTVNLKQYDKIISDYENDLTKGLKILQSGGITMKMIDDPNNNMKEQEQRQKADIKKNNNRIELNTVQ